MRFSRTRIGATCAAVALAFGLMLPAASVLAQNGAGAAVSSSVFDAVRASAAIGKDERTRVIVTFSTARGTAVGASAQEIGTARNAVLASLPANSYELVSSYRRLRSVSLAVDKVALDALRRNPRVLAVNLDHEVKPSMIQANALTGVGTQHMAGFTGDGTRVAIIDSGVDTDHTALANDLIGQQCFRTEGDCPAGPNVAEDQGGHGTHVAGMITGNNGAAPDAEFASLKVFTTGNTSDTNILNALDFVLDNAGGTGLDFDFVNMSLGAADYADVATCDADSEAYVAAFADLNAQGVAVFVATGNSASTTAVSSPGCVTGAIGVGSSGDATFNVNFEACTDNGQADKVSCFSNATPLQGPGELVDLMAPGCYITSTGLNNSLTTNNCGTSMATPYAVAIAAVVKEYMNDNAITMTPAQFEEHLESTGNPIADYRMAALPGGGPRFPRVNPNRAIGSLGVDVPEGFTVTSTTATTASMTWTASTGATEYRIYRSANGGAVVLAGTVTAPTLTFTDTGVPCGNLTYYVKAFNGTFESIPSNDDTDTPRACPATPTALTLTAAGTTGFSLAWVDNATGETGYVLERKINAGSFVAQPTLPANSTTASQTGLACGVYTYRVAAVNGADFSAYSNEVKGSICGPANDLFANATVVVPGTAITLTEPNVSYGTESAGDPQYSCKNGGAGPGFQGVWYKLSPTANTPISISTLGSTGAANDQIVSLLTYNGTTFTEVACADDVSDTQFRTVLSSNLVAGTVYYVFVSEWVPITPGTAGTLSVAFSFGAGAAAPANDLFANAQVIPPGVATTVTVSNIANATATPATDPIYTCSGTGGGAQRFNGVWYRITPTAASSLTVNTEGSTGESDDTVLGVYTHNGTAFTQIACDDDGGTGLLSTLTTNLNAGTTYYVFVSQYTALTPGSIATLSVSFAFGGTVPPPPHDLFANAKVISTTPYTDTQTGMQGATVTAGDPLHACYSPDPDVGSHNVWYRFTAPSNGLLSLDTLQSSGTYDDTVVSVLSGTYGAFTSVACNDDADPENFEFLSELVDVPLVAGQTYTIYVSRWSPTPASGPGTLVLNVEFASSTAPNITVTPTALEFEVAAGASDTAPLVIGNSGDAPLAWTIAEAASAALGGEQYVQGRPGAAPFVSAVGSDRASGIAPAGSVTHVAPAAPQGGPITGNIVEQFDNITTLPAAGWALANRSEPLGTSGWFQGNPAVFPAFAGATNSYIGANFNNTAGAGTISNWLITPEMTLTNGKTISFYTRIPFVDPNDPEDQEFPDRLEVRLSTAGASTDVGTTSTSVGVFTTVLTRINPDLVTGVYPQEWTLVTLTLSGLPANASGRVAFRYFVEDGGPTGANSSYIGIDSFFAGTLTGCDAPEDIDWLSVAPATGTTAAGATSNAVVTADASDLDPGTYEANLCVDSNDASTPRVTVPVSLTVVAGVEITPATLPNGAVGTPYGATISASGDSTTAPFSFSQTDGVLPPGLTLFSNGNLTGTPTTAGSYTFEVTVADSSTPTPLTATIEYTVVIGAATTTVVIAPATLPNALIDTPYSAQLSGSGAGTTAPYTFAVTSGVLPTGLTLTPQGLLAGTPTVQGTFAFTVTATDSTAGTPITGTRAYTVVVGDEFVFADGFEDAQVPGFDVGTAGSKRIALPLASELAFSESNGQRPILHLMLKGQHVGTVEARCAASLCEVRVTTRDAKAKWNAGAWSVLDSDPYLLDIEVGTKLLRRVTPAKD